MGGEISTNKYKDKRQRIPPKTSLSSHQDPKKRHQKVSRDKETPFHPHTKNQSPIRANSRETQMYQMYAQQRPGTNPEIPKIQTEERTVRRDRRKRKHIANKSPWDHTAQSWWEQSGIIGEQK
jgi:hypothetical protein